MTASSIQFATPGRVQLLGLPQRTSSSSAPENRNPGLVAVRTAPPPTRERVCRNLFGSPKAGEVKQLLNRETQEKRAYFMQRYNFDILRSNSDAPTSTTTNRTKEAQPMPLLMQRELQQHAENQKRAMQNNKQVTEKQPQPANSNGRCGEANKTLTAAAGAASGNNERLKPYARQILLTDCYSVRKTIIPSSKCSSRTAKAHAHTPAATSSSGSATATTLATQQMSSEGVAPSNSVGRLQVQ